jgi:hypothetical protein
VRFRLVTHAKPRLAAAVSIESNPGHDHAPTVSPTTVPGQHPAVFARAFNSGSADTVMGRYESGAVLVPEPVRQVTGDALFGATADFLGPGLPIKVRPGTPVPPTTMPPPTSSR